jgi:hypothetical protein
MEVVTYSGVQYADRLSEIQESPIAAFVMLVLVPLMDTWDAQVIQESPAELL